MQHLEHRITELRQANRVLKLGYLLFGVVGLAGYALAQTTPAPPGSSDPNQNEVRVDINKVGDAQSVTAVDHERGFAVVVDETGKISIVHRDGTILVPKRKHFVGEKDVKSAR